MVRDEPGQNTNPDAYFLITGSHNIYLTSSRFTNLYDNNKWNLSLTFKHSKYPQFTFVSGGANTHEGGYDVGFYAINSIGNTVLNEFKLTQSLPDYTAEEILTKKKKFYIGAHLENFTGSVSYYSDVKISHLRYWQSLLSDEEVREHSFDVENYGLKHPYADAAPGLLNKSIGFYK